MHLKLSNMENSIGLVFIEIFCYIPKTLLIFYFPTPISDPDYVMLSCSEAEMLPDKDWKPQGQVQTFYFYNFLPISVSLLDKIFI